MADAAGPPRKLIWVLADAVNVPGTGYTENVTGGVDDGNTTGGTIRSDNGTFTTGGTIGGDKKETFTTAEDNQSAVTIKVYQGERPMAADNRLLGEFNLEGIPPSRMGVPQIEVAFNIDANGILNVTARDKGTGKEQTIQITSSGGLSKSEIERMQRDADAHAAEDKKKRDLAEARLR